MMSIHIIQHEFCRGFMELAVGKYCQSIRLLENAVNHKCKESVAEVTR